VYDEHEYGDVILPFILLRRLDCVLEPVKDDMVSLYQKWYKKTDSLDNIIFGKIGHQFYNKSKYDIKRLSQDSKHIHKNFKNYRNGFSNNISEILKFFEIDKYVDTLHEEKRFFQFIKGFSSFDLHPNVVDNRTMGLIYEELIRISSEKSNKSSGDHFTPRDVVNLLVSLVISGIEDDLKGKGKVKSIYDPCCGTGGMLTISKEYIQSNINPDISLRLVGQELKRKYYSICKSDMIMMDEDSDLIKQGSTLSKDYFENEKFDIMITNPPFGEDWKSDQVDVRKEYQLPNGRFKGGLPKIDDGSLLFLQHLISKMEKSGSRIGIVFNGSPLFVGDSGSGTNKIRRWIIENDLLECVIQLPDQLFFRTGIVTYLWILSNNKKEHRKGKIQLLDCSGFYQPMVESLNKKRKYIPTSKIKEIVKLYLGFKKNKFSKIYSNESFGYTRVVVEQPLVKEGEIVTDSRGNPKPDTRLRNYERVPLKEDINSFFDSEIKPHLPKSWLDRRKDEIGFEINFIFPFFKEKETLNIRKLKENLNETISKTEDVINYITK